MKFTCTQDNLLQALSKTAPIAGRNKQLPSLRHVLLRVDDNTLSLTTTDLEVGVHTTIGGKAEGSGACAVPARSLLEYVQQLPKTHPVVLEIKDDAVSVETKGFRAQFPVSDPDEFPLLPSGGEAAEVVIKSEDLCSALDSVAFAASREDTRPEIHSVFLKCGKEELYLAATDSFRLAEAVVPVGSDRDFSILLPLSSAHEIVRLFSGCCASVLREPYYSVRGRD